MTLDKYRKELLNAVRTASSSEEVQQLVENAMAALLQKKVHGHLIARFVDKVIFDIEHSNDTTIQQTELENIKTAKNEFTMLKKYLVEKA